MHAIVHRRKQFTKLVLEYLYSYSNHDHFNPCKMLRLGGLKRIAATNALQSIFPCSITVLQEARLGVTWYSSSTGVFFAEDGVSDKPSYFEEKKLAKEIRRQRYNSHQERLVRLKNRRRPDRFQDRIAFRSFFIPEKVNNEYMNRKARQAGLDWQIDVAVVIQRNNVVVPDLEEWDENFENLRDHMWQYGKEYPKAINLDIGVNNPVKNEELLALLPKGFTPAPRETEHDRTGNVRTTDRKLKTNIYLAVKDTADSKWQLPTVTVNADETLLDAAKRALKEKVGSSVEFWCPSNCPAAVFMDPFTEEEQKAIKLYGKKTFVMKVSYDEGKVKKGTIDDFAWLDREEFTERVKQDSGEKASTFYHYLL
jgi:NUDIX domain